MDFEHKQCGQIHWIERQDDTLLRVHETDRPAEAARQRLCDYRAWDIRNLNFLRQAPPFGFSLDQSRQLLALYQNPQRRSAEVHDLVVGKLEEIDRHIEELLDMKRVLAEMVDRCPNDESSDCTIIEGLSSSARTGRSVK